MPRREGSQSQNKQVRKGEANKKQICEKMPRREGSQSQNKQVRKGEANKKQICEKMPRREGSQSQNKQVRKGETNKGETNKKQINNYYFLSTKHNNIQINIQIETPNQYTN